MKDNDSKNKLAEKKDLNDFLFRSNLLKRGEKAVWTALSGGVSSDIWRVDLPAETICVKRALANLKVIADWQAPIERNNYEWEWFKFVHQNFPSIVPRPIAHDAQMQMLAMEFLAAADFPIWKAQLMEGIADKGFAAKVGSYLGKIHARSAFDADIAETFATDDLFFALRIEPYLLATAEKHPDLAPQIKLIAEKTLALKIALVHGDVSPKNILVGKNGPVFLDAETAWFGDPAFDLAFCLNHFLLKSVFRPAQSEKYRACFRSFTKNYLTEVVWEACAALESRAARLLPILLLARIDGKSPVEYIVDEKIKDQIRQRARKFIVHPPQQISEIFKQ